MTSHPLGQRIAIARGGSSLQCLAFRCCLGLESSYHNWLNLGATEEESMSLQSVQNVQNYYAAQERETDRSAERMDERFKAPTAAELLPQLTQEVLGLVLEEVASLPDRKERLHLLPKYSVDVFKPGKSCWLHADILDSVCGILNDHNIPARVCHNFGQPSYACIELTLPPKTWIIDLGKMVETGAEALVQQAQHFGPDEATK